MIWNEIYYSLSVNIDRCFQLTAHIQFHKSLDNKTVIGVNAVQTFNLIQMI